MRFLFTCGGTAGHINPALSVAGKLRELLPDAELLFVGAEGQMETELIPREGYALKTVKITNLRRGFSLDMVKHNAATLKNVVAATSAARKIIRAFKPDAVLGTGGYVCYPVLRAAHQLKVPTALHESNAVPGLTTKLLAGLVDKILVGFPESRELYRDALKVEVTGTPVRGDFSRVSQKQAKMELGLPLDKPFVLSYWGSLGAGFINDLMVELIERSLHKPFFSLMHATGKRYFLKVWESLRKDGAVDLELRDIFVKEYIYDMPRAMAAADLVLCRAGASTLSELAVLGKPAILIPSPNVTNNHQEKNALVLEQAGAAKLLREEGLTVEALLAAVYETIQDKEQLACMSEEMKKTGNPEATNRIAEIVLDLASRPRL
ncbi:MAG: undecaprenyldiphospho-muramoylpentapeptide beta-N-acetylglucosaminyltransferase [Firmicutes bacterium]|nr:undecaprenyldiphospho-muramoylpentapeptide beta-N-acetylglucosaminyltransferase [Bacillota bacterium]